MKKQFVLGPSHVVRWRENITKKVVESEVPVSNFIGRGGLPIWSKWLFQQAQLHQTDDLFVFVPDFRLGNSVCLDESVGSDLFQDGYVNVSQQALSNECDQKMLARGLDALKVWQTSFPKARYIFWSVFGRQVFDRLQGKHIVDKQYQHPAFTYKKIVRDFPALDIVDLNPLLSMQMHETQRLFIDTSCHPTLIGILFLERALVAGEDVIDAYTAAVGDIETQLFDFAKKIVEHAQGKVLLTGRSVWLDTLVRYCGATGVQRLAELGLVIAAMDPHPAHDTVASVLSTHGGLASFRHLYIISAGGRDLFEELSRKTNIKREEWSDATVIDWESNTAELIQKKKEQPQFQRLNQTLSPLDGVLTPELNEADVELGPFGIPTWYGLTKLLKMLAEIDVAPKTTIENGVLRTTDNIAFLVEGNHSVIKYVTGEIAPSAESFQAFNENIKTRKQLLDEHNIQYAHVIFPDKQSVLTREFPISPVVRLGDVYVNQMERGVKGSVIYPADYLHKRDNVFLPLDTHMTDQGSVEVLRLILNHFNLKAYPEILHLEKSINQPIKSTGDLGGKLTPKQYQDSLRLNPDWKFFQTKSSTGFNDGLVDILFNPTAKFDKTLLLFGDSFFRMMLAHFNLMFTKVICLRTRFLHPEMLISIEPDFVLTGNAERYLSNVTCDEQATPFFYYPYLRQNTPIETNAEFLDAWRAVLSPRSQFSKSYFEKLAEKLV